jgi:hypothetical protein
VLKKFPHLFLVLVIEGGALMAVELMGAKLVAPFYGSSLYVWTAVLTITVLGLTLGYYAGGRLSKKRPPERVLFIILGTSALLVLAMPLTALFIPFVLFSFWAIKTQRPGKTVDVKQGLDYGGYRGNEHRLLYGKQVDIETLFLDVRQVDLNDAVVLTDDKPILELLNIQAGNTWRKGHTKMTKRFYKEGVPLFR